ncbi:MAG: hypothetical protein AB9869_34770 [Verrucomicrobiia bacterium]
MPEGLDDQQPEPPRPLPDWAEIHNELGRRSVTLRLLWQEYRERFPNGYGCTRFCEYYHRWTG